MTIYSLRKGVGYLRIYNGFLIYAVFCHNSDKNCRIMEGFDMPRMVKKTIELIQDYTEWRA